MSDEYLQQALLDPTASFIFYFVSALQELY